MPRIAFLIPGDINLPTGGYAYDRKILAALQNASPPLNMQHITLPASYPMPSEADLCETAAIVASLPKDCLLFIDGLAYGAMPEALIHGFNRPIVALVHHALAHETGLSAAQKQALFLSEYRALEIARAIIVTSPLTARLLQAEFHVPESKLTIAMPGIERPLHLGMRILENTTSRPLKLLAVGSVVPRKAYDLLVEALASIKHLAWQLEIIGALTLSPETVINLRAQILREELEGRIKLVGALSEEALAYKYRDADMFILASYFEGYGMVLGEAMAYGLPIIATTGGAAAETLPDGAGIKCPVGDAMVLSQAIESLLTNAPLRHSYAMRAYEAGKQLPDWHETAQKIASVLKSHLP